MTHQEREAEAARLMAILAGKTESAVISEDGNVQVSNVQPFIEKYSVEVFPQGKLVLLVMGGHAERSLVRVQREFNLRAVYEQFRPKDNDLFLEYLFKEGYLKEVEALEMHIHTNAYDAGIAVYNNVG
jgi:hypothetical protein